MIRVRPGDRLCSTSHAIARDSLDRGSPRPGSGYFLFCKALGSLSCRPPWHNQRIAGPGQSCKPYIQGPRAQAATRHCIPSCSSLRAELVPYRRRIDRDRTRMNLRLQEQSRCKLSAEPESLSHLLPDALSPNPMPEIRLLSLRGFLRLRGLWQMTAYWFYWD